MATIEELRNKYKSSFESGTTANDTEPDYMALYQAKKAEWNKTSRPTTKSQNTANLGALATPTQTQNYNRLQNVTSVSNNLDKYLQEDYKMTDSEKQQVKDLYEKKYEEYYGDVGLSLTKRAEAQKKANADEDFQKLMVLQGKVNTSSGVMSGIISAFDPLNLFGKAYENLTGTDIVEANKTQQPLASGIGYGAGKLVQYGALSPVIEALPGVGTATKAAGTAIGSGVSALTKGKIGAEAAGAVATRLLGDTAADIALDTLPEAAKNISEGQSAGEVAKNALSNIAVNIGFNRGAEALGAAFKAIKNKVFTKEQADVAAEAIKQMDDATKSAVAADSGFNSVEEMEQAVLMLPAKGESTGSTFYVSPELGASRNINQIKRPIPTIDESISAMQNAYKNGEDLTKYINDVELAKWYDNLPKEDKILLQSLNEEQQNQFILKYSPVSGRQVLQDTSIANTVDDVVKNVDMPVSAQMSQADNALKVADDMTSTTTLPTETAGTAAKQGTQSAYPARDIPEGYKERGYAESVIEKSTHDEALKQSLVDEPEIYKVLSNKETMQQAENIFSGGLDDAIKQFNTLLEQKNPIAVPLGDKIARAYTEQGNTEAAVDIVRQMSEKLTQSGQFSQAAAMTLLRNDPMSALRYIQRDIDALNTQGAKKFGKKWKDFKLTDEEVRALSNLQQGDSEGIKQVFEQVGSRLAKEYPSTWYEKAVELTRISMLLNPRTNVRNITGNIAQLPLTALSRKVSALGQNAYKLFNPDYTPTQALLVSKDSKKLADTVWNDFKNTLENPSKYNDSVKVAGKTKQIFKKGKGTEIFDTLFPGVLDKVNAKLGKDSAGLLETVRNINYELLDMGDTPFVKKNFTDRLRSYIQAQKIKSVADVPADAIDIAYTEALKATYKDDTVLSNALSSIKKNSGVLGEIVLPFTKTPANIAMRGIDYSPAGFINTLSMAKNGADVSKVIDEFSKNLTGTGLIALGILLYNNGFITGSKSDNSKQAAFMEQQGFEPYAFKTDNGYFTYDWAQPAAIPLLIGTAIAESRGEDTSGVANNVYNAFLAAANSWFELSPLQSVQDIFGGYGTPAENIAQTVIEFPQRFIPSASGATARVRDTTQRSTYSQGDLLGTQINLAKSKIPGLSQTLPASYDTWGKEKQRDTSTFSAIINQYLNPGVYSSEQSTALDDEINRLYNILGDENIFPRKASYSITKDNTTYDLDNEEYSEYQRIMGEMSFNGVQALMEMPAYQSLTDDEKSDIIQNIYKNAKETADYNILSGKNAEAEKKEEAKIKKVFLSYTPETIAEYYVVKEIINNTEGNKNSLGKTISGSAKNNAIKKLTEIGYSKAEATRLYEKVRG